MLENGKSRNIGIVLQNRWEKGDLNNYTEALALTMKINKKKTKTGNGMVAADSEIQIIGDGIGTACELLLRRDGLIV